MIDDKWLIALAKCRQIARQMRPSLGRYAVLDVPLFVLKAFDRLFDHITTIEHDRDLPVSGSRIACWLSHQGSADAKLYPII